MDVSIRNRFMPKVQSITLVSEKETTPNNNVKQRARSKSQKLRFNTKFSYFTDKTSYQTSPRTSPRNSARIIGIKCHQEDEKENKINKFVNFVDFSEFDTMANNQILISIQCLYNPALRINIQETQQDFEDRLTQVKENIIKRYPFINIIMKQEEQENLYLYPYGLFEVQLCSNFDDQMKKYVIYSKKQNKVLPSAKQIVDNIKPHLQTCNLKVKIDCELKDGVILGTDQNISLDGLQVNLKQKQSYKMMNDSASKCNDSFSSSMFSTYTERTAISYQRNNNHVIKKANHVKLFLSPNMRSRSGSSMRCNSRDNSYDTQNSSSKQNPVKMFSTKGTTDKQGNVIFKDIVYDIESFDIEILGNKKLKNLKTTINLTEMIAQQNTLDLVLNLLIERDNIVYGLINVVHGKQTVSNAKVKFGNFEFYQNQFHYSNQKKIENKQSGWVEEIDFNEIKNGYSFYTQPGNYFIEVTNEYAYTEHRQVHLKKGDYTLDIDLRPTTYSLINLRSMNLLTRELVSQCLMQICDSDDNILQEGVTDQDGNFQCKLMLLKRIKVYACKENYLKIQYDFDLSVKHVAQSFDIQIIPENKDLSSQFELLIYIPHNEFKINFQMVAQDDIINADNREVENIFYDEIDLGGPKLIEFSLQNIEKDKEYEFQAYSILQKPNIPQSNEKDNSFQQNSQFFNTMILNTNQNNNDNDENMLFTKFNESIQFKTQIFKESFKENKDSSEKRGSDSKLFGKSVQSINGFFLKNRVAKNNNERNQTPTTKNKYNYINEKLKFYDSENAIKIYAIHNNQIQRQLAIYQNVLVNPKSLGRFDTNSKKFSSQINDSAMRKASPTKYSDYQELYQKSQSKENNFRSKSPNVSCFSTKKKSIPQPKGKIVSKKI